MNDEVVITLENKEGKKENYSVLTVFDARNSTYIALLSHLRKQVELYKYKTEIQSGEEGISISEIESDMEFNEVLQVFESILN